MDIALLILGIIFTVLGIIGCILPILPGPPLSFVGLLMLHFSEYAEYSTKILIIFGIVAVVVTALDYLVPILGTKKLGGSKYGVAGSMIGLILGIFFFPPLGIIFGPFAGAIVGELIKGDDFQKALKSGFGSFAGFVFGTGIKLIASSVMAWYFFAELI